MRYWARATLYGQLLALALSGCSPQPVSVPVAFDPAALEGQAALDEVATLVALGPRDAGTTGSARAAAHIAARLRQHGLDVAIDAFADPSPAGTIIFRNVVAVLPGRPDALIVLGSHYDTKSGLADGFAGANDSGSSTGLLIELARVMRTQAGPDYPGPEIQFVFFDGEECQRNYGPHDGFHGSRHHVRKLVEEGRADRVRAMINLDMVGDRDLSVTLARNADTALRTAVLDAAHAEGCRDKFRLFPYQIGDDHEAFLKEGIPAINIIDFQFGSRPGRNDYWHTAEDTMDKLSAESLGLVGRVVLRVVNTLL